METTRDLQECMVLDHVNYVYGAGTAYEKHALRDINLVLGKGEFMVYSLISTGMLAVGSVR